MTCESSERHEVSFDFLNICLFILNSRMFCAHAIRSSGRGHGEGVSGGEGNTASGGREGASEGNEGESHLQ